MYFVIIMIVTFMSKCITSHGTDHFALCISTDTQIIT